jgi:hypothetical protein
MIEIPFEGLTPWFSSSHREPAETGSASIHATWFSYVSYAVLDARRWAEARRGG